MRGTRRGDRVAIEIVSFNTKMVASSSAPHVSTTIMSISTLTPYPNRSAISRRPRRRFSASNRTRATNVRRSPNRADGLPRGSHRYRMMGRCRIRFRSHGKPVTPATAMLATLRPLPQTTDFERFHSWLAALSKSTVVPSRPVGRPLCLGPALCSPLLNVQCEAGVPSYSARAKERTNLP